MMSSVILIISAMVLCVGSLIGGVYATVLSAIAAIGATISLVITIINRRNGDEWEEEFYINRC